MRLNAFLLDPDARIVNDLLEIVARYGTPEEINRRALEAGQLPALLDRVREIQPSYLPDLQWLAEQRDRGAFVSVADFRRGVVGDRANSMAFRDDLAVTLEVSSLQYFPWVIEAARRAIADRSLMPGRWIRVRKMAEQEADGDLPAVAAAMQIIGASVVETLDTKGTDGSNVHLDGPATITGYFGGIGQPNDHPLMWVDEFLHFYTTYGVQQVLNINPGTVLAGYLLHRLGVDIEFKISVFMGNDNPFSGLWTLMGARLFAREDGTTPLVRLQLGQLGRQRDARDLGTDPPGAGAPGRCPFRAPHHRDLQEHRAPAVRPARGAGRASPTTWRTSPPSTKAAIRTSTRRTPTPRTSSTTSGTRPR